MRAAEPFNPSSPRVFFLYVYINNFSKAELFRLQALSSFPSVSCLVRLNENKQVGWWREMMKCIVVRFFFFFFGGYEAVLWRAQRTLKNVSVVMPAVSQTEKHNRRADVQGVWPRWSLEPPLPLILRGNALAGTVCFPCVCGLNCRFTYISDPRLLISFLATGVSTQWAEGCSIHRSTLSPRG